MTDKDKQRIAKAICEAMDARALDNMSLSALCYPDDLVAAGKMASNTEAIGAAVAGMPGPKYREAVETHLGLDFEALKSGRTPVTDILRIAAQERQAVPAKPANRIGFTLLDDSIRLEISATVSFDTGWRPSDLLRLRKE